MRGLTLESEQSPSLAPFHAAGEGPAWYAVQTHSRCEKKVATQLYQKGVNVYLPVVSHLHRWSDRDKRVQVPLFPGYAFVRIVLTPISYLLVLQTRSIVRFICKNGTPVAIPDREVDDVQRILKNNHPCTPLPYLGMGARVRIQGGCLDGLEGMMLAQNSKRSFVVSMELIQRSVTISTEGFDGKIVESRNTARPESPSASYSPC